MSNQQLNGWNQVLGPDGFRHVVPRYDLRNHRLSERCWCRPFYKGDGVMTHNSGDGREDYETGRRKWN